MACSRRAATLLWLTGDDILAHRGAARGRDERAVSLGRRASAVRENMVQVNCRVCGATQDTIEVGQVLWVIKTWKLNEIREESTSLAAVKGKRFRAAFWELLPELWSWAPLPLPRSMDIEGLSTTPSSAAACTAFVWPLLLCPVITYILHPD